MRILTKKDPSLSSSLDVANGERSTTNSEGKAQVWQITSHSCTNPGGSRSRAPGNGKTGDWRNPRAARRHPAVEPEALFPARHGRWPLVLGHPLSNEDLLLATGV